MLEVTEQRLASAKNRVDDWIDLNILTWAKEEILLPAQQDITQSVSARAADGLSIEKTGRMKVDLVWEFLSDDGAPVHFFIEYGTKPHVITPSKKQALHWKGPSGVSVFAKIVQHGGTEARNLVHIIEEERRGALRQRIIDEVTNHMETSKVG
tara:strand:+ start:1812 stop:2270 length:459 start_codon:yes stop_codon:yes gene_type:complete